MRVTVSSMRWLIPRRIRYPDSRNPSTRQSRPSLILPKWHAFILSRYEIERPEAGYWVSGRAGMGWRMELAMEERPVSWARLGACATPR